MDAAVKERLLEELRQYLDGVEALPVPAPDPGGAEADLFTVFVELAAVRNEVRTESRLVKEALDQFRSVFGTLQSSHATLEQELKRAQADARERGQALLRPLLLDLLDLRDRLDAALQAPAAAAVTLALPLAKAARGAGTLARRDRHHGPAARPDAGRTPRIAYRIDRPALRSASGARGRHQAGRECRARHRGGRSARRLSVG